MNHPADIRHFAELDADARHEAAIGAAREEICEALLVTEHAEIDDERLLLNIDAGDLREAYSLYKNGARDAALIQFVLLLMQAANKTAVEESEAFVARRRAESRQEAASERYDALREEGLLG